MTVRSARLAVYTTAHPGVTKYLLPWYRSLAEQTDRNYDLWIGLDGIRPGTVKDLLGEDPAARWVPAEEGASPAGVRHEAIKQMVELYPAVVFVDSDDLLEKSRVEAARRALLNSDLTGCAMHIIDESGRDTGLVFSAPGGMDLAELIIRNNVFGLSNTAYRSELLRQCLPLPEDTCLVDWFLATRAWTLGARLGFDPACRMSYRQYHANTASILPPFTARRIRSDTQKVLGHYRGLLNKVPGLKEEHRSRLESARDKVEKFRRSVEGSPVVLKNYLRALNSQEPRLIWWSSVASPELEHLWSGTVE
ncbi:MAG: hypothetical protein JXQ83_06435 [Candidatus Glassbacteria bacterium]|nr:hypothetical protein [Candidatus Glassbacteria bacterium]